VTSSPTRLTSSRGCCEDVARVGRLPPFSLTRAYLIGRPAVICGPVYLCVVSFSEDTDTDFLARILARKSRVGRKDVGMSGESESVLASWNAGLSARARHTRLVAEKSLASSLHPCSTRPTRPISVTSRGCHEYATRMLRGKSFRGISALRKKAPLLTLH